MYSKYSSDTVKKKNVMLNLDDLKKQVNILYDDRKTYVYHLCIINLYFKICCTVFNYFRRTIENLEKRF